MENNHHPSLAGTGLMLASPLQIFSQEIVKNIKSRGYAAKEARYRYVIDAASF